VPNVTEVLVRCYDCGHIWQLPLNVPLIGAANGDTITFVPHSINAKCPKCGTYGVNYRKSTANVTGEGMRGLFALLQSVSPTNEDLEKLATIASEVRKSDANTEAIVELIKTQCHSA
jgi:hypothetical protein